MIDYQRKALKTACDKKSVAEEMYSVMVENIWKKISNAAEIDGNQIDRLFSTRDFKEVANQVNKQRVEAAAKTTFEQLSKLSREIKKMVERRQGLLCQESNKYPGADRRGHVYSFRQG